MCLYGCVSEMNDGTVGHYAGRLKMLGFSMINLSIVQKRGGKGGKIGFNQTKIENAGTNV